MKNLVLKRRRRLQPSRTCSAWTEDGEGNQVFLDRTGSVYQSQAAAKDIEFFSLLPEQPEDAHLLFDPIDGLLMVALASGDLVQLQSAVGSGGNGAAEIIGSFPSGIVAFAASPGGELFALVTGDAKLVLMRRPDYSLIREWDLLEAVQEGTGMAAVSVGWGRKETQFHGKAGKEAAHSQQAVHEALLPSDDRRPRLSWRNDGECFACSYVMASRGVGEEYREIRIFDQEGALLAVKEATEGLGGALGWRQDGSLLAASQRRGDGSEWIIFYEKNGLRHGEFRVASGSSASSPSVREIQWNCDGSVLALLMSDGRIDLWTSSNYHWYLKYSLPLPAVRREGMLFNWSPSRTYTLQALSTDGELWEYEFGTRIDRSACDRDDPLSLVAVVDGPTLLLTPFAVANVPPPLAFGELQLGYTANCLAIECDAQKCFRVAAASPAGLITVTWMEMSGAGGTEARNTGLALVRQLSVGADHALKQLVFRGQAELWAMSIEGLLYRLQLADGVLRPVDTPPEHVFDHMHVTGGNRLVLQDSGYNLFELCGDQIVPLSPSHQQSQEHRRGQGRLVGSLSDSCLLFYSDEHRTLQSGSIPDLQDEMTVATNVTSFIEHPEFLCVTDPEGYIRFYPRLLSIGDWPSLLARNSEEGIRLSEGGAHCIAVVPARAALILQMPRGNLETVYPRAFVIHQVKSLLDALRYREAFLACRKHRIDLNLLHDHNPELFRSTLSRFVSSVPEVEYLNLFISSVREENVKLTRYASFVQPVPGANIGPASKPGLLGRESKVNFLCRRLREELEACKQHQHTQAYAETIMSTFVCQQPPDHEAALSLIRRLGEEEGRREKSLKYLLFLVPAEGLYRTALGMYDLPLALSVARRSSMDPAEYTALLTDLHEASPPERQKFLIDDYLQRYELALAHLLASAVPFAECLAYCDRHQLYRPALALFEHRRRQGGSNAVLEEGWRSLCRAFAEREEGSSRLGEALDLFLLADDKEKACHLAIQAGNWQKVLQLRDASEDAIGRVAKVLLQQGRYGEACHLSELSINIAITSGISHASWAIDAAMQGAMWREAGRLDQMYNGGKQRQELLDSAVRAKEASCRDLCSLQVEFDGPAGRLEELQSQLVAELDPARLQAAIANSADAASAAGGDPDLADQMSTLSMRSTSSALSLLSQASTLASISRASTRSKSKRKADRQRTRGKPGSPFEREYLRDEIKNWIAKFATLWAEHVDLVRYLAEEGLLSAARELQEAYVAVASHARDYCERMRRLVQVQEEKMGPEVLAVLGLSPWSIPPALLIDHPWRTAFDLPVEFGQPVLSYL